MRRARFAAGALILAATSGCAVFHETFRRPDYAAVDQQQTKRLLIITQPLPDGQQVVGDMWSRMARRQVNLKRQFIAKETAAVAEPFQPKSKCATGIEGILWLKPDVKREGDELVTHATASLYRCSDGELVWSAQGGGRWPVKDETAKEITATYTSELGPAVEPYVGPTFHLVKAMVDQMPDPVLTEADKDEKIELGD